MPETEHGEDAFLWINTDATNLLSRDHSTSTNSFVRRAKHHKKWKLSKLQASCPRTFPWTYRPESSSSRGPHSLDEELTAGSRTTSTLGADTQQSPTIAASQPEISDHHPHDEFLAIQLWEPPRNDIADQDATLTKCPWYFEFYDFDADAQTPLLFQQGTSRFESSLDADNGFHDMSLYAQSEAPSNFRGDFANSNPSEIYNERSLYWPRQTIQDRDFQPEQQNDDPGFPYITNHGVEDSSLPNLTSFPGFSFSSDQTVNMHTESLSIDTGFPDPEIARVPASLPDELASQRFSHTVEACLQLGDQCCCKRYHANHYCGHCLPYPGQDMLGDGCGE